VGIGPDVTYEPARIGAARAVDFAAGEGGTGCSDQPYPRAGVKGVPVAAIERT
jgi:hypothetical protein